MNKVLIVALQSIVKCVGFGINYQGVWRRVGRSHCLLPWLDRPHTFVMRKRENLLAYFLILLFNASHGDEDEGEGDEW